MNNSIRNVVRAIIKRYRSPRYQGLAGAYAQFVAQDARTGRPVIIDVLPKLIGESQTFKQYYAQMKRQILRLDHPRIVQILELAEEKGIPYLITAAAQEARTLTSLLKETPLDLDAASSLIAQISSAVDYAAHQDVPHGSLTPDKVLLDEQGEVSVTGFGRALLAAITGARNEEEGSPYLAPEQRLTDQVPTAHADVYSLAAILYRLITGQEPAEDPRQIPPPDQRDPSIPKAVGEVTMRALSPDPGQRYDTAEDFVLALRSAIRSPRSQPSWGHAKGEEGEAVQASDAMGEQIAFPEPLEIPAPDLTPLADAFRLADEMLSQASSAIPLPDPLPMPKVDWDEWISHSAIDGLEQPKDV